MNSNFIAESTFIKDINSNNSIDARDNTRPSIKQGIDIQVNREKRKELQISLRKKTKEEGLFKRRRQFTVSSSIHDTNNNTSVTDIGQGLNLAEITDALFQPHGKFPDSIVQGLNSSDFSTVERALHIFYDFSKHAANTTIIQKLVESQIVPRLVQCMTAIQDVEIQNLAGCCLSNIGLGDEHHVRYLISCNVIPAFIELYKTNHPELWEIATWGLGNIAGENASSRDLVLQHGALINILQLCVPQAKPKLLDVATWCLSNFTRHNPRPNFGLLCNAIPTLENLLGSQNLEVIHNTCNAIQHLTEDESENNAKLDYVCTKFPNLLGKVVHILKDSLSLNSTASLCKSIQLATIKICGNFAVGNERHCRLLSDLNVVPLLLHSLSNTRDFNVRKYICWCFSNIAADATEQLQVMISTQGLFPQLIQIAIDDKFDVSKEAMWTICNAVGTANDSQMEELLSQKILTAICYSLAQRVCAQTTHTVLKSIHTILKYGKRNSIFHHEPYNRICEDVEQLGGLTELELLQTHELGEISSLCRTILEEFFEPDEIAMITDNVVNNNPNIQSNNNNIFTF